MAIDHEALRLQYNPDGSKLRRMQLRMLEMLEVLDEICRRHGISYWLSGGSMLGAVRHQGFIPWDDDLDIEMLRPDFEKLMRLLPAELPDHLKLQWHTTDENYFFSFAKVRDTRSRLFERNGYDRVFREHGIFVDIFPVEPVRPWIHRLSCMSFGHCYKMFRTAADPVAVMPRVRRWVSFHRRVVFPVLRALNALCPTKYYDFALGIPYYQRSLRADYLPVRYVPFEDMQAPVMREAEKCLAWRYGDYMQLPANPGGQYHADELEIW